MADKCRKLREQQFALAVFKVFDVFFKIGYILFIFPFYNRREHQQSA